MEESIIWNLFEGLYKRNELNLLRNPELQKCYKMLLEKGRLEDLRHLRKVTKSDPLVSIIQNAYKILLKKCWVGAIKDIQKETGIKAKFKKNEIDNAYEAFISRGLFNHLKILENITGMEPSPKILYPWYKKLIKKGEVDFIKALEHFTNIPFRSEEYFFLQAIRNGDFKLAANIYKSNKLIINKMFPDSSGLIRKYILASG